MRKYGALAVIAALLLAGCGGTKKDATPPTPPPSVAASPSPSPTLQDVVINGESARTVLEQGRTTLNTSFAIKFVDAGQSVPCGPGKVDGTLSLTAFFCKAQNYAAVPEALRVEWGSLDPVTVWYFLSARVAAYSVDALSRGTTAELAKTANSRYCVGGYLVAGKPGFTPTEGEVLLDYVTKNSTAADERLFIQKGFEQRAAGNPVTACYPGL